MLSPEKLPGSHNLICRKRQPLGAASARRALIRQTMSKALPKQEVLQPQALTCAENTFLWTHDRAEEVGTDEDG